VIIWQLSADVGLLLLPMHYLLHSNILYTQHTTHQLIFVEGGKQEKTPQSIGETQPQTKLA
jgi:hypothetical protein